MANTRSMYLHQCFIWTQIVKRDCLEFEGRIELAYDERGGRLGHDAWLEFRGILALKTVGHQKHDVQYMYGTAVGADDVGINSGDRQWRSGSFVVMHFGSSTSARP